MPCPMCKSPDRIVILQKRVGRAICTTCRYVYLICGTCNNGYFRVIAKGGQTLYECTSCQSTMTRQAFLEDT